MLPPGFDLTVERLRGGSGAADAHGNVVVDWTAPSRLIITRCWIGSNNVVGVELNTNRQTVIAEQWWYGPEDADVVSTDRIRDLDQDITYEIDSDVVLNRDPTGLISHKICKLKLIIQ